MGSRWLASLLVVACPGCSSPRAATTDAASRDAHVDALHRSTAHQLITNDLDLLFVIDNSPGMADKQTVFAANLPVLVAALDAFPAGRPSLRIAVVDTTIDIGTSAFGTGCPSPDPGDNGLMQSIARVPGCSPPTGPFISDIPSGVGRVVNYSGTLEDTLACIAQLGEDGCGFEAPLEAMKRALDGSVATNAGFIRDNAALGVVILTDEDDCSVSDPSLFTLPADQAGPADFRCQPLFAYTCDQPISPTVGSDYTNCAVRTGSYLGDPAAYVQFLDTVKDASEITVATIIGDPSANISTGPLTTPVTQALALLPSCTATINGDAAIGRPGLRLADFAGLVGSDRSRFDSVCQSDYSDALTNIAALLSATAITSCLTAAVDTTDIDAVNPGQQLGCTITSTGIPIKSCQMLDAMTPDPASPTPCAWYAPSANCTTTPTGLQINLVGIAPPVEVICPLAP